MASGSKRGVELPTEQKVLGPVRVAQGLRLTVIAPEPRPTATFPAQKVIVGRSAASDLPLADPTASSFHVELSVDGGAVRVRDLGSRNGTLFAGARLDAALVPSGSTLEIGSTLLRVELDAPSETVHEEVGTFGELVAASSILRELFARAGRLAKTELALLIEGPTGTGKELVARGVHDASVHAAGPFIVLDCTSIPSGLAESVLFGHERGAFTGATERRAGAFEAAGRGTVFLDEVGELPLELQPKLLRVLEQRQVVRIGSTQPVPVAARVLSATWRDLRGRVNRKEFREDLYYRLAQARLTLPALAERREDIPALVQHFLARLPSTVQAARTISDEALRELMRRELPGNVRELKNTVERAAMLADGPTIGPADLAFERILMTERARAPIAEATPSELPLFKEAKRTLVDEFEKDYLERLLVRVGRNLSRASALAGVERHHLRELLKKHGLGRTEEG